MFHSKFSFCCKEVNDEKASKHHYGTGIKRKFNQKSEVKGVYLKQKLFLPFAHLVLRSSAIASLSLVHSSFLSLRICCFRLNSRIWDIYIYWCCVVSCAILFSFLWCVSFDFFSWLPSFVFLWFGYFLPHYTDLRVVRDTILWLTPDLWISHDARDYFSSNMDAWYEIFRFALTWNLILFALFWLLFPTSGILSHMGMIS